MGRQLVRRMVNGGNMKVQYELSVSELKALLEIIQALLREKNRMHLD